MNASRFVFYWSYGIFIYVYIFGNMNISYLLFLNLKMQLYEGFNKQTCIKLHELAGLMNFII
ncbi:hypothetical protein C4F40_16840 [Sphingobacterium sp. Ka21]|uniref:Uncharacterized protein n=1 Tax=Sphingobacterium pedocola TaxID=2082722 RepID=A0ABR9TC05_9SPHI|nr:hypothetical protein [Sphingobacterium pedocola]